MDHKYNELVGPDLPLSFGKERIHMDVTIIQQKPRRLKLTSVFVIWTDIDDQVIAVRNTQSQGERVGPRS